MPTPLIYVIGASGSGKDSLVQYARRKLVGDPKVVFARNYITRSAAAGGENHVAVSDGEFEARLRAGDFAMHWYSHGHAYGVGMEIDQWMAKGKTVVVIGSRAFLREARQGYPDLLPVRIVASPEILRRRLLERGRETGEEIERRLVRHRTLRERGVEGEVIREEVIRNESGLEVAGDALVALIRRCSGIGT